MEEDPDPQPRQSGRGPLKDCGSGGWGAACDSSGSLQRRMDTSDDDEAHDCDGLMLDSETEGSRESGAGDGDGDGDVDHCGAGAAEDNGAGVSSSRSSPHGDDDAAKVTADGECI